MCGIVGYVGPRTAAPILLDGLRKLEYRGYDSAGLAVHDGTQIEIVRAVGKLDNLATRPGQPAACGHDGPRPHALGDPRPAERAERAPARRR